MVGRVSPCCCLSCLSIIGASFETDMILLAGAGASRQLESASIGKAEAVMLCLIGRLFPVWMPNAIPLKSRLPIPKDYTKFSQLTIEHFQQRLCENSQH